MSEQNPWRTLASREVYSNAWIRVREDQVLGPDGQPGIYGVVETAVATGVVAVSDADEVVLVGQFRYPLELYSWEIVEGGAEEGETPLQAARRELQEEAGLLASSWRQLGGPVHLSNCFSNEVGVLFMAQGLTEVEASPDSTEALTLKRVSFSEAVRQVDAGEITDAMSIMGILRAARARAVEGAGTERREGSSSSIGGA